MGGPYHIETSPLIYRAKQWTGFYLTGISVMKELNDNNLNKSLGNINLVHATFYLNSIFHGLFHVRIYVRFMGGQKLLESWNFARSLSFISSFQK